VSSDCSQTPPGELGDRRVAESSTTDFASVEYLVSKTSIASAWKKVRANKGAPGVDRVSTGGFPEWVRPKWDIIKRQLLGGGYQPSAALRVEIPKESGGVRLLGIPCVMDRVLMQAVAKVLGCKSTWRYIQSIFL